MSQNIFNLNLKNAKNPIAAWVNSGYNFYAKNGFDKIKYSEIAKMANVSRTSFYYLFNSIDDFIDSILRKHQNLFENFFIEFKSRDTDPDEVYIILAEYEIILHFHQQLLFYSFHTKYKMLYEKINNNIIEFFFPYAVKYFFKEISAIDMSSFLKIYIDIWFSNIKLQNHSATELHEYSINLLQDVLKMKTISD